MRLTRRATVVASSIAVLALAVSGCTTNSEGGDDNATTLVFGANLALEQVWDPHVASQGLESLTNRAAYDTLVGYEGNDLTELVGVLATDWEAHESGTTFTFELAADAVFNSGAPVTADDVVFSFQRLKNLGSPNSYLAESIVSVTALAEKSVEVEITSPNTAFLRLLADPHFVVLEEAVVRANGGTDAADAAEKDTATAWLTENSAGSGPYQIASAIAGEQLVFEANPNAWKPADYFTRVVIQNTAAHSSQAAAIQQGDIDITQLMSPAIIESIPNNGNVSAYGAPGMVWYFVAMNRNAAVHPAMANEDVQNAIRYALDYDGMRAMGPSLAPWYGMIPDYMLGGVTKEQGPTQDLAQAEELLAEAGYADGFTVELCTTTSTAQQPTALDYAQKVQADLAEVGITVDITAQDGSAFLTRYRAGECAMVLTIDGPAINDPSHMMDFIPNGGRAARVGWVDGNLGSDGALYLDLAAQAMAETDEEVRGDLWNQVAAGIAESGPYISIGSVAYQFLAQNSIKGLDTHANSMSLFDPARLSR